MTGSTEDRVVVGESRIQKQSASEIDFGLIEVDAQGQRHDRLGAEGTARVGYARRRRAGKTDPERGEPHEAETKPSDRAGRVTHAPRGWHSVRGSQLPYLLCRAPSTVPVAHSRVP